MGFFKFFKFFKFFPAFACNICGRRFGVASNMNRHAKRCALKPVNALHNSSASAKPDANASGSPQNEITSPSTVDTSASPNVSPTIAIPPSLAAMAVKTSTSSSLALALGEPEGQVLSPQSALSANDSPSTNIMTSFSPTLAQHPISGPTEIRTNFSETYSETDGITRGKNKVGSHHEAFSPGSKHIRGRAHNSSPLLQRPSPSQLDYRNNSSSPTGNSQAQISEPKQKRRRRARSPSTWIPESLVGFELDPVLPPVSVPLPPVRPGIKETGEYEERDSYDEHVSLRPYHPSGWSGRLPGPALISIDDTNGKGSLTYKFMF